MGAAIEGLRSLGVAEGDESKTRVPREGLRPLGAPEVGESMMGKSLCTLV